MWISTCKTLQTLRVRHLQGPLVAGSAGAAVNVILCTGQLSSETFGQTGSCFAHIRYTTPFCLQV